ncbi:MAG: large repetitive protein, partial [Actinomycetota bacterium]|nr:large repetitive protein [Actinomycetota bacterium]
MRFARLISFAAVALFVVTANASSAGVAAPSALHGFLLRADEPLTAVFHRTPSFAWNPVPGARRYEFQLSTTSMFRDNGILYRNNQLLTPVEAPPLTLPWITGSPHALYARVRAVLDSSTTDWSEPFGFDVAPPAPPTPLPGYTGLLRWTPIEGADGYEVWLVDAHKMEIVRGNVLDEREFYTFHQALQWTGTVRWRIRALRGDVFNYRINGIPAAMYGAWSPVYTSSNSALTTGKITLLGTASDIFSTGTDASPAHKTMPAFLWTGNQSDAGKPVDLYRVYIYTDKQCLNRVYTSAVVGSPAYAPRPYGPLALPTSALAMTAARAEYLEDGTETNQVTYDGEILNPATSESVAPATATTTMPGDVPNAPGTTPPIAPAPTTPGTPASAAPAGSGSTNISVTGNLGAPVDLWDTEWPKSGYYWTVVPVQAVVLGAANSFVAAPGTSQGSTVVPVGDSSVFTVGQSVTIGNAPNSDTGTITAVGGGTITLGAPLTF